MDKTSLIKCKNCLLPIPSIFFKDDCEKLLNKEKWNCKNIHCKNQDIDNSDVQCPRCKDFRDYDDDGHLYFFKRYNIPKRSKDVLLLEEVLYNLPQLLKGESIDDAIAKEKLRLLNLSKDGKFNDIINLFQEFDKEKCDNKSDDNNLMRQIEVNCNAREEHCNYLNSVNDLINYIASNIENAKSNLSVVQSNTYKFLFNVKQGYSNEFVLNNNVKKIRKLKGKISDNKNIIKTFLVVKLINDGIIESITFEGKNQPKLEQKSSLKFERRDTGYVIQLIYKEVFRKYICCDIDNHEYVLDTFELNNEEIIHLRRIARTNSIYTLTHNDKLTVSDGKNKENKSQVRFYIMFLVQLLNSLEAD
jgi:hypothetical protein